MKKGPYRNIFIAAMRIHFTRKLKKKSKIGRCYRTRHNVGKAQVHAPTIIYRTYTEDDFRLGSFTNVPEDRAHIVTLYVYIYIVLSVIAIRLS